MCALMTSTIPSLIGGVSQQPWNVRLPNQAEEQINCCSGVVDFMRRRPATQHIARLLSPEMFVASNTTVHAIHRDAQERYVVVITNGALSVFDLEGRKLPVHASPTSLVYLSHAEEHAVLSFLTINDTTLICNMKKSIAMSVEITPPQPNEAFVFIKQASYNTTYAVTLNGITHTVTTDDGLHYAGETVDSLSSVEIAESLRDSILQQNNGWLVDAVHSTLWIRRSDAAVFNLEVFDSRSNTHITSHQGTVQQFSDLPVHALHGSVVEVTGDAGTNFDNYYVQFECDNEGSVLGKGVWRESVRPGIQWKLDPRTMPQALTRNADGSFSLDVIDWGARTCGDEHTAPTPSFVGQGISGMFFYRNRLAFMAGENLILSQAGELFHFFPSTTTTLIDSDPIDIAASHTRPTPLRHAVQFGGGVLLFTADTQFFFSHGDILSNATASLKPVTEFNASMSAPPISSGKTLFFTLNRGSHAVIREYLTLPDQTGQHDAAEITTHVPRYVAGNVHRLICAGSEDTLFALSHDQPKSIWVYKYFWNGIEKIQSAWSRWDMDGDILDGFVIETTLYLLMSYADGLFLEAVRLESGYTDEDFDFEVRLDRKSHAKHSLITYNEATNTTRFWLPYVLHTKPLCLQTDTKHLHTIKEWYDDFIFIEGDLRNIPVLIGFPFTSSYTFSTFAPRDGVTGNALLSGRLQLRSLILSCVNTGYMEVTVTPNAREVSTYTFNAKKLGDSNLKLGEIPLYTGTWRVPLLAQNTQLAVRLTSNAITPFALINATWEGLFQE